MQGEHVAGHFRDFRDPNIDMPHIREMHEPSGVAGRVVDVLAQRAYPQILNALGGSKIDEVDGSELWQFTADIRGETMQAGAIIHDPPEFASSALRMGDIALFYGFTEGTWQLDEDLTSIPDDADTGNFETDGLVPFGEVLYQRSQPVRNAQVAYYRGMTPILDRRAAASWKPDPIRTKEEIRAHYDDSNDGYVDEELGMLDLGRAQYSSGLVLPGHKFTSLDALQETKADELDRKLQLGTAGTLLEVGGGWGGLAVDFALRHPNLEITSLTVSHEQYTRAQLRAENAGVADRVKFLEQDYRDTEQNHQFDRVVSVEMIEAVDWRDLDTYFASLAGFVDQDDGVVAIQSINIPDERYPHQRHTHGFADTAIFPGGYLVSRDRIEQGMDDNGMRLHEATELGPSYALTLREWIRNKGDKREAQTQKWASEGQNHESIDRKYRGDGYYLAMSQVGFRNGHLRGSQMSFIPSN